MFLDLAKLSIQLQLRSFTRKLKNSISLNHLIYFSNLFSQIEEKGGKLGIYLSDKLTINQDVSQDLVLGPLIILLYVNGFSGKLKGETDVFQFALDTSMMCKFQRKSE